MFEGGDERSRCEISGVRDERRSFDVVVGNGDGDKRVERGIFL